MLQNYVLQVLALGGLLLTILILKSALSGYINDLYKWGLSGKQDIKETHELLPEVKKQVEELDENFTDHSVRVNQKLDEHNRRMKNVEETIAIIHVDDDEVNEGPLKQKLGVEQLNTRIKKHQDQSNND